MLQPQRSTFSSVFSYPPIPTLKHFLGRRYVVIFVCQRCRKRHWEEGKKLVFKAFDLKKHVVTGKCCSQVTSLPKNKARQRYRCCHNYRAEFGVNYRIPIPRILFYSEFVAVLQLFVLNFRSTIVAMTIWILCNYVQYLLQNGIIANLILEHAIIEHTINT